MRERGIYDLPAIRRDLERQRQGQADLSGAFFRLIQFELWARRLKTGTRPAAGDPGHDAEPVRAASLGIRS
jgi:hypothetical protein